ncbi:MAG: hypothetical protein ACRDU8_03765 [Egibacteraceae bacterium]
MATVDASPTVRRWPHAPGQGRLLVASLIAIVASFLAWLSLPFGNLSGFQGPGQVTFYAGFLGIAGSLVRRPRIALAHAAVVALLLLGIPLLQVMRAGTMLGWRGWLPGVGLLLTLAAGVTACTAALKLLAAARGR